MTTASLADSDTYTPVAPLHHNKTALTNHYTGQPLPEPAERNVYLVRFDAPSVVARHLTQPVRGTDSVGRNRPKRLQLERHDLQAYVDTLAHQHQQHLAALKAKVGAFTVLTHYHYAINGVAIQASPEQAAQLRGVQGVRSVEADQKRTLNTDTGPVLIGAPAIWQGQATSNAGTLGEGLTIAVLDTGINTDHPSFADIGGDGYNHSNPLGAGNYLGDCASGFASLCNDKLIGVVSYPEITQAYSDNEVFTTPLPANGEDYNGHGTHVAATAAGNVLFDVKEVLPDSGTNQSDGIESGFVYERISGVAPHANLVSYQVCLPGETDDIYNGCYDSVIARAIDDAIASGVVDVINFSVSGGGDPWSGAVNEAWLAAHNAGIFTVHSASNSGPDNFTTDKQAPWITVVGATTHGRLVDYEKQLQDFSGGTFVPAPMTGSSNTGAISAPVIYAGDVVNPNAPGTDPAQCMEPFPAGTFDGQIVVCDRGDIPRIDKARHVADGGAGGFVLANVEGGADNLANDTYVIPGIHLDAADSATLRSWLASGSNHRATITAADGGITIDDSAADIVAEFSSRGPNATVSTLTPHLTAPGVDIYAAFSDEHYGHDNSGPAPADYAYLSGTSMASPHVAGAAALVKAVRPDWSVDEIRSALMMTAATDVTTGNSGTPADWFDMGAGRVKVDNAVASGLVMDETYARYIAANPATGGEPRALNTPAVVDTECFSQCTWQRTVTATQAGIWTVSPISQTTGFSVTVSPLSFTLAEGESQTLTITLATDGLSNDEWGFGRINLTSSQSPALHIPVVAFASNGTIPTSLDIEAHRDFDSLLVEDIFTQQADALSARSYGFTPAILRRQSLPEDPTNSELLDGGDGVALIPLTVTEQTIRLVAEVTDSSANDIDLFVIFDENEDGTPQDDEIIATSTSFSVQEYISLRRPTAGNYWVAVQNWAGSGAQNDDVSLYTGVLDAVPNANLDVMVPASVAEREEFDLTVLWALPDAQPGDRYYGAFALGNGPGQDDISLTTVDLRRADDDVFVSSPTPGRVQGGDTATFSVNVITNDTNRDREYNIEAVLPDTLTLLPDSVTPAATVSGKQLSWTVVQPAVQRPETRFALSSAALDQQCATAAANLPDADTLAAGHPLTNYATYGVNVRYGEHMVSHLTVARNGFVTLGGELSPVHLDPAALHTEQLPNAVIAPYWQTPEQATAHFAQVQKDKHDNVLIDWQSQNGAPLTRLWLAAFPQAGEVAMIMAYPELSGQPASMGIESMQGTAHQHTPSEALQSGDIWCYYPLSNSTPAASLQMADAQTASPQIVADLRFSARVADTAPPGPFELQVISTVPNIPGTQPEQAALYTGLQVDAAPVANIVADQITISSGQQRSIAVQASDANGDNLQYAWTVSPAGTGLLSNSTSQEVLFLAPTVTTRTSYTLTVTVTDSFGRQASDSVTVVVTPPVVTTSPGSGGSGGVAGWLLLAWPLAWWRWRTRRQLAGINPGQG